GMPTLSDPGARLVAAARGAGHDVAVVPGPSAVAAALAVSGLPAAPHTFLGFLPARAGERRRALEALRDRAETLVWFEAPHRLRESLADAAAALGARRACVARELTKVHEEAACGDLAELAAAFAARETVRGEVTVVVEGASGDAERAGGDSLDDRIRAALATGEALKALSKRLAEGSRLGAREVYARALALREEAATGEDAP
ncbi:MAG: SAM-dependent methyltransferase, partial [Syntrophomonadaceae bacterium]